MGVITRRYFGQVSIDGNFSYTVPSGATNLRVLLHGGGGPGGSANAVGGRGGGGAGGCFASLLIAAPVAGDVYSIFVPKKSNVAAGDATFSLGATVLCRAKGGAAGGNAITGSLAGAGGVGDTTGCIGDEFFKGGDGRAGIASAASGGGGGGASTGGNGIDAPVCGGSGPTCANFAAATPLYGTQGSQGHNTATGQPGITAGGPVDSFGEPIAGSGGGGATANSSTLRARGTGSNGLAILIYEVPDDIPEGSSVASVACDGMTGGDDADIDGRAFDGCGGAAPGVTYARDPDWNLVGAQLYIEDGTLSSNDLSEVVYNLIDAPTCSDPQIQGVRMRSQFPDYDIVSTPEICTLIWEDTFSGSAGDLAGRSHAGGSAGTGTYRRVDNSSASSVAGAQLDGAGAVYMPNGNLRAMYDIDGLTLPLSFDMVIDVERTSAGGGNLGAVCGTVRGHNTYPPIADQVGLASYGFYYQTEHVSPNDDGKHGHFGGWVNKKFGLAITGSATDDPPGDQGVDIGEVRSVRLRVRNGVPTVYSYIGPDDEMSACDTDWRLATGVHDGQFGGTPLGNGAGLPGIGWNAIAGIIDNIENSYRLRAVRIYEYTLPVSGAVFTNGYPFVMLRWNPATETGYQVALEGTGDGSNFELFCWIYLLGTTTSGYLRNPFRIPGGIPVTKTEPYNFDAFVADDPDTGNATIYAVLNGIVIETFDLIADAPEYAPNGGPVASGDLFTDTGLAVGIYDGNTTFDPAIRAVLVSRVELLCPGSAASTESAWLDSLNIQCVANGTSQVTLPVTTGLQAWHVGDCGFTSSGWADLSGFGHSLLVQACDLETNGGGSPGPIDPVDPGIDVGTTPFEPIGERMFGVYSLGDNNPWPPVFDSTVNAAGTWSVDLSAQVAGLGRRLILGCGSYRNFRNSSGNYDGRLYDAFVIRLATMEAALRPYGASGVLYGVIIADDVKNVAGSNGWPPSGLSNVELNRMCGVWKTYFPWLRTIIRCTPEILARESSSIPNCDVSIAQYKSNFGPLNSWIDRQYANRPRTAIDHILWSLNITHGGDGSSGLTSNVDETTRKAYSMTPAEIMTYGSVLARLTDSEGLYGWHYDSNTFSQTGILNTYAELRNIMVAVP